MTSKRGKPEIIFDILLAIQAGSGKIKPTRLLYKSNLSHSRLKLYMDTLLKQGLVALESSEEGKNARRLVVLTPKGYTFISEYRKMRDLIDSFGI